jgi:O-antigen ligase
MFLVILPMTILIFLKSLYLVLTDDKRPEPFGIHPNVATEISLITLILAIYLNNSFLKIGTFILVIATCYLCASRGAFIASIIVIFTAYFLPLFISRITLRYSLILIIISMVTYVLIGEDLYNYITKFLLLDSRVGNIAGRLPVWELAYQSILKNPVTGMGFWVHPMGYEMISIHMPHLEIHNAFLRIASENGLGLLIMILVFLIIAFYKLIKVRNFSELAILTGALFFLFFATRHLTLNLLNIILYFVILKAMIMPTNKLTNDNQEKL